MKEEEKLQHEEEAVSKTEILTRVKKHEIWIDYIKLFACILVVTGHFFMSMKESGIITETKLYIWFTMTIYYFHVPLFFICSGYLFQKYSTIDSVKSWTRNVIKKAVSLGIPYVVFSTVTWLLKSVFSGSVNGGVQSNLLYTILVEPISPYWYLYCLFCIFLITPTFQSKKTMWIAISVALVMKVLYIYELTLGIHAIYYVFGNEIWFLAGMALGKTRFGEENFKYSKFRVAMISAVFIGMSIYITVRNVWFVGREFFMGTLACAAVVEAFAIFTKRKESGKVSTFLIKSTLPIYLLHTIAAACFRVVLIKLGIYHVGIHVVGGLFASFAGPMIFMLLMGKIKVMEFLIYPQKYIQIK